MGDCPMRDCPVVTFLWETILWEVGDLLFMAQSGSLDSACASGTHTYESTNVETKCTLLKNLVVEGDGMAAWMGKMENGTVVLSESGPGQQTRPLGELRWTRSPYPRA